MTFEWDETKRRNNLQKHGVDFFDAVKIFARPVLEKPDQRKYYGEERLIAIGQFENDYFVVVYTWRDETCRVISAWRAGKNDKEAYDNRFTR